MAATGQGGAGRARNAGLDLARALAIALVLTAHTAGMIVPLPALPLWVLELGAVGVELFFSLSGFLIGAILIALARDGVDAPGIGRFLARRWLRTLPLYYAAWLAVSALGMGGGRWWWHDLLFLQNFAPPADTALIVSWSLVLEEWFYLAFPLAMLGLAAAGGRARIGARGVLAVALAAVLAFNLVRLATSLGWAPPPYGTPGRSPFERLDCAAYGVLAAVASDRLRRTATPPVLRRAASLALALGLPAAAAWATLAVLAASQPADALSRWRPYYDAVQHSGLEATLAAVVLGLAHRLPRAGRLVAGPAGALSRVSYSAYLVHVPILAAWATPAAAALGRAGAALALTAATLAFSAVTYALMERPFLGLRDRLLPQGRTPGRGAALAPRPTTL